MKRTISLCFIAAIATIGSCLSVWAKEPVVVDGYQLVEVTADGVNIRSGAGTNFPIAYKSYIDYNGKPDKYDVSQAYKGERYFVKDAGDWWEIHNYEKQDGDSPQFISKKFATLLETEPFDFGSQTAPQIWGFAEKAYYEEDEYVQLTILTIYPEKIAVTQIYSIEGDYLTMGNIFVDKGCISNALGASLGTTMETVPQNGELKIWDEPNQVPPHLVWEYSENSKSSFDFNGEKYEFVDISTIPAEQWIKMGNSLLNSPNAEEIRLDKLNPAAYVLKSDLDKFVKIK